MNDSSRFIVSVIAALLLTTISLQSQTPVTTSGGTANAVPKFTGTATIGNSTITDSGGNIGIGTSTPAAKLEVAGVIGEALRMTGVGTNPVAFRFMNAGNSAYFGTEGSTAGGYFTGSLPYSTVIYSPQAIQNIIGGVARLTIDTSGNVGIGLANPTWPLHVNGYVKANGISFPDGSSQNTASYGTITGVLPGSGLSGGGYSGNVSLAVDSTVARTTVSQSFTGNQTIYGDLALGYTNGQGGHFSANHGAWISDNFGGTPFSVICANLGNRQCWATDANGNSGTTNDLSSNSVHTNYLYAAVKNFRIDHPLDPANKHLFHASVESSDVKNLYDGVVELDDGGEAWILLPEWFQALNRDFRYQLTAIGTPGPSLYVAEEIAKNQFKIAGGQPRMKVSWMVTGIRQDVFIKAHPMEVEAEKPPDEKGFYVDATLYGLPASKTLLPLALRSNPAGE